MLEAGTTLQDRYQILKRIGQGGMGAVYLASDQRLGSTVALKETFFSDPVLLAAFKREARLLAGLKHAALPKVSDHFADGEGHFLVMEFIAGDDLEGLLKKRDFPFQFDEVFRWTDQLLDALDYLHSQDPPVIHRDIKPQNLKLTSRSQIVLLDFGLAKGAATGLSVTGPTTSIFGYTPSYAPLEQIQGSGTDAQSDLYSLAATIYQLLTATKPVDALARASAVVNGKPDPLTPPHELNPHIPDSVSAILMRAMALRRDERPSSAADMRSMLRDAARPATDTIQAQARPEQSNTAASLDPPTEALTIKNSDTHSARPLITQRGAAPFEITRQGNLSRAPMAAPIRRQSTSIEFRNQADSSPKKLIAVTVVLIAAIVGVVYALNRGSNTDTSAIKTDTNQTERANDSNPSSTDAKTPASSPAESTPSAWPSAASQQTAKEKEISPAEEDDTAREEQREAAQEPEQSETKPAETEKTGTTQGQPHRGQDQAGREDSTRPPPPPHLDPPPPDHMPPPRGQPPPRRRP